MRRASVVALALTVLAGAALLLVRAGQNPRYDHYNLGVGPVQAVAKLTPTTEVCQTPVGLPEAIDRVVLQFGAPETRDPRAGRVDFQIRRDDRFGPVLARKTLERGLMIGKPAGFVLGTTVAGDQDVAICLRSLDVPVDLYGDVDVSAAGPPPRFVDRVTVNPTLSTSTALINGEDVSADLFMTFPRADHSTQLEQIPASLEHASRFKLGGEWILWALLGLGAIGAPVALARALRAVDEP
jgi:hypothetical protein